jgi:hypothetical protein
MNMPGLKLQRAVRVKKRSNAKTKISGYTKRARRGVLGLTLKWHDTNPLIDSTDPESITQTEVWHSNPTQRLICRDMWARCQKWIVESEFTWLVSVVVVYASNRGGEKRDEAEFRLTCGIRNPADERLSDAIEGFITESRINNHLVGEQKGTDHKSYGEYLRTEFVARIVGI